MVIVKFNAARYQAALEAAFKKAVDDTVFKVYKQMMANLVALPWKHNPVKVYNGGAAGGVTLTSDLQRAGKVMENILRSKAKPMGRNRLKATISYLKKNWKEAHVGIYYEVGTGTKYDGTHITNLPKVSGFSSASHAKGKIASRSRFIDYVGLGPGKWIDMGGNVRVTGSRKAGEVTASFTNYIGPDVSAHKWFRNAVHQAKLILRYELRKAIRSVPISKYMSLNNISIKPQR